MTSTLTPAADFWDAIGGGGATDVTHELIWVGGPDAISFADSLLSQNVAAMTGGEVRRSFLLAPNGKLRALLWVLRGADEIGLVSDAGWADVVVADLERFKLRVDAAIDSEPVPLFSVMGPVAATAGDGWNRDGDNVTIRADLDDVPRYLTAAVPDGIALLSVELAESLRIGAGEPRMGVDLDEATIPQESGLTQAAVDFDKGCYLGQELVARIDSRGHVNRRLVAIEAGATRPPAGAELFVDGKLVGSVTSVAWSPSLGAHLGLGLVRREAADGSTVTVRWSDSAGAEAGGTGTIRPVGD